jgi:membrane protein DedA with SNARE-associated domain
VAELQFLVDIFQTYGYAAVFLVLLACGFGLPIPEDITLVAGGVISGLGFTDVHIMFAVSMVGVLLGDGVMFTMGHFFGPRFLKFKVVQKLITPERYEKVQEKFEKYGQWVIFFARFMPGLRSPIFVVAGTSRRISYLKFFAIDGFAALISVPVWVYLGYFGAHNLDYLLTVIKKFQTSAIIGVFAIIVGVVSYYILRHKRQSLKIAHKNDDETAPNNTP